MTELILGDGGSQYNFVDPLAHQPGERETWWNYFRIENNYDSDEVYSSGNEVDDNGIQVVPGTPCLARFSEDQTIYRCDHKFSTRAPCLIFDPSGPWCWRGTGRWPKSTTWIMEIVRACPWEVSSRCPPTSLPLRCCPFDAGDVQWDDDDDDYESDVDGMLMIFEIKISSWSKPFQCAPVAGLEREWRIKSQGPPWDFYLPSSELQVILHVGLKTLRVLESPWLWWLFTWD